MAGPHSIVRTLDLMDANPQSEVGDAVKLVGANVLAALFDEPQVPTLGRFEVRKLLGRGGMGSVFEGWDPELERPVAIKILNRSQGDESRDQVFREAQGLARVRHAGVITVFEVGQEEGRTFLVMELMRGGSLSSWLHEVHSLSEVLEAFSVVAAGLASAHASGLVHRDIKPDNLLLDEEGHAKLSDFGLVRREGGERGPMFDTESDLPDIDDPSVTIRSAEFVGTPAYAAPEQLARGVTSPSSDVYSLGLTLFELIYGRRFDAKVREFPRRASAERGGVRVSAPLRELLGRTLAADPTLRPSAGDLGRELAELARPKGGRRWLIATTAVAVVGLGVVLSRPYVERVACESAAERVAPEWMAGPIPELRRVLEGSEELSVRQSAARTTAAAERIASDLGALRFGACSRPREAREVLLSCADELQASLELVMRKLHDPANTKQHKKAMAALRAAGTPRACELRLNSRHPVEPSTPEREALRLDIVDAKLKGWDVGWDVERWPRLIERARALGDSRSLATAQFEHAMSARVKTDAEKIDLLYAALATMEEWGTRNQVADVWSELILQLGGPSQGEEEFKRAEQLAIAASQHPDVSVLTRAQVAYGRSRYYFERHDWEKVKELQRESIALAEEGDHVLQVAKFKAMYAQTLTFAGEKAEAIEVLEDAIRLTRTELPASHRRVTKREAILARYLFGVGRLEEGVERMRVAREGLLESLGPDSVGIIEAYLDAGHLVTLGRHEEAAAHGREIVRICELHGGMDSVTRNVHFLISFKHFGASLESHLGRPEVALAQLAELEEAFMTLKNAESTQANFYETRGRALLRTGKTKEALADFQRSLELRLETRKDERTATAALRVSMVEARVAINSNDESLRAALEELASAGKTIAADVGADSFELTQVRKVEADVHLRRKDFESARKALREGLLLWGDYDPVVQAELHILAAKVELADGKADQARAALVRAREAEQKVKHATLGSQIAELEAQLQASG